MTIRWGLKKSSKPILTIFLLLILFGFFGTSNAALQPEVEFSTKGTICYWPALNVKVDIENIVGYYNLRALLEEYELTEFPFV